MSKRIIFENKPEATLYDSEAVLDSNEGDSPKTAPFRFDINLFELGSMTLHRRRLIAMVVLTAMIVTTGYMFLQPNRYTSQATVLPSGKTNNNMSALKNLVGLGDATAVSEENSSLLFPLILQSNLIVDGVLSKTYTFSHKSKTMSLTPSEFFSQDNPDKLRRSLREITSISLNRQTGEIVIGVETKYPEFSQALLREYLAKLEDYNLNKRRSSARENERYLAHQIEKVSGELQAAENALEAYQLTNMDWLNTSSPEILKELARLQREVDTKSSTYQMLTQQHETAKLEAQKDIPIVSILDEPSLPTMKSGPFRRNVILFSGALAFIFACMAISAKTLIKQGITGRNQADYDIFRQDIENSFPRASRIINRIGTTFNNKAVTVDQ